MYSIIINKLNGVSFHFIKKNINTSYFTSFIKLNLMSIFNVQVLQEHQDVSPNFERINHEFHFMDKLAFISIINRLVGLASRTRNPNLRLH